MTDNIERIIKQPETNPEIDLDANGRIEIMRMAYPGIDSSGIADVLKAIGKPRYSAKEECIVICPKISYIAERFGIQDPYSTGFGDVLQETFERLSSTGRRELRFAKDARGSTVTAAIEEGRIVLDQDAIRAWEHLELQTPGDLVAFPMQCGCIRFNHWRPADVIEEISRLGAPQWAATPYEVAHYIVLCSDDELDPCLNDHDTVSCPGMLSDESKAGKAVFEADDTPGTVDNRHINFIFNSRRGSHETSGFVR